MPFTFKQLKVVICLMFLLLGNLSKSQDVNNVVIDKVNTQDMSNQFITALKTDEKGYLWVGTLVGLNKYNGYNFEKYNYIPEDSSAIIYPSITKIHSISTEHILIGTQKGLCIYNYSHNNFTRIKADTTLYKFKQKQSITSIVSDKEARIFIGTAGGLMQFNYEKKKLEEYCIVNKTPFLQESVQAMCIDRLKNLWLSYTLKINGNIIPVILKHNLKTFKTDTIKTQQYGNGDRLGIYEDYLGNIWICADNGLIQYNQGTKTTSFYKAPNNFYSCIAFSPTGDNVIWQSFWSFGVTTFDIDKKEFKTFKHDPDKASSIQSSKIWALHKDENNIVWIGSDVGLQKISNRKPNIETIKRSSNNPDNTLPGNIITKIKTSKIKNNIVYAAIDGEGFSILNTLTGTAVNFGPNSKTKNAERFVNSFFEDEDGTLYVGGQDHFQRIKFSANNIPIIKTYFSSQEHYISHIMQHPTDKDVLILMGKSEVIFYNKRTENFDIVRRARNTNGLFSSAFVVKNEVYFLNTNNILKYNCKSELFYNINLKNVGFMQFAYVENDTSVYITSRLLGLIRFNPLTKKYIIIKQPDGTNFPDVNYFEKYNNQYWFCTTTGLYQWVPLANELNVTTIEDGLPSNIINDLNFNNGYVFLATQEGVAIYNPYLQSSHFAIPKIDVYSIKGLSEPFLNRNFKNNEEVNLNYKQNSFRVNFTLLDFNLPEKNRYKYKLSPLQTDWVTPNGENYITFNSLEPGSYKFELIGANADNIWSSEPYTLYINIVAPIYKRKIFYIILFLVITIAVIIMMIIRVKIAKNRNKRLEKIIHERTAEINEQKTELLDSINYAERLQRAIFVGHQLLKQIIPESFIYFNPRDRVSGDFFWIGKHKDVLIIFAGDCTGHGVPGALLSVIGTSLLNKIVYEESICMPGEILTRLNILFYRQLNVAETDTIRDGMDASVITINLVNKNVFFSGSKNNGIVVQNKQLSLLNAERTSIGETENALFKTINLGFEVNRSFYLFSDGIKDQFGGPDLKKYSSQRLKQLLLDVQNLPLEEQEKTISKEVELWKGNNKQTDDMLLIGFKF